jgi:hypothetical protein
MPLAVEALADAALIAVLTPDGHVRGTGFMVDASSVLTCHHVVAGDVPVQMQDPEGSIHSVCRDAITSAPEIDLALIRAPGLGGTPLPLADGMEELGEFWTKGFHRLSPSIRAAFPVAGTITGTTSVTYSTYTAEYRIDDVLVLRDDDIEAGLSGAPVLDRTAGVVVGIVSTKLTRKDERGGFAIPVGHAAAHPALAATVAHNAAAVPAYGAFLNVPAALALCAAVTSSAVEHLVTVRRVDLSRHVARADIEAAVGRFFAAGVPLLTLVGPSGVGKSTELAALSQRTEIPMMLLRGSGMRPDCADLGEAVATALSEVPGEPILPDRADRALARVLASAGGLVVLLDGFNEAPMSGHAFEEWIARTRAWLRETNTRLILSCRPELWQNVGRILEEPFGDHKPVTVSLGEFTIAEYERAAAAYGLPSTIQWPILRLPLALTLCARSQREPFPEGEVSLSINDVIESFFQESARRLAIGARTGSAGVIRNRIYAVAAIMWESESDVIDGPSLDRTLGFRMADALVVDEGMMAPARGGYRFVYDDVADWLKAQSLDLSAELATIQCDESYSWRRIAPVAYALRDVAGRAGEEALRTQLMELVDAAPDATGNACGVVMDTLVKIADARPYRYVLAGIAQLTLYQARSGRYAFMGQIDSTAFWRNVPIPLSEKLGFLRQLVPIDDHYISHFRPQDWARWDINDLDPIIYYSALCAQLVAQESAVGLPLLLPWFDDGTRLTGGSESTVADVAMGILFRLRRPQEEQVWNVMVQAGLRRCGSLIQQLVDSDPQWLGQVAARSEATSDDDALVVHSAYLLTFASLPERLEDSLREAVASRYEHGLSSELRSEAIMVLSRGSSAVHYVPTLIAAYHEGAPNIDEWALLRTADAATGHLREKILAVVIEALEGRGERSEATLGVLAHARDSSIVAVADRTVRRLLDEGSLTVNPAICGYVKDRLWSSKTASDDLIALTRRVIAAPADSGRRTLAGPLTSRHVLPEAESQRISLLQEFIDMPGDPAALIQAGDYIVKEVESASADASLPILQRITMQLDPSDADRILFTGAWNNSAFANMLARWLMTDVLRPPGKNTNLFKQMVSAGEAPNRVAQHIIDSRYRT